MNRVGSVTLRDYVAVLKQQWWPSKDKAGHGRFGYDPAFVPDETGHNDHRTMAELSPEEKHAVSHRGKAARMLARHLGLEAEAAP